MAERFLFFNAMEIEPGVWDREYQAQHFAEYFGSVLSTGLLHTDKVPGMGVAVEVGTLNTVVSAGKSIMRGHLYENTTPLTLSHSIPEPNLDRIDRVVLRLNLNNSVREIRLRVLEGESSANPVAPDLVRTQFIHEISLAKIRVRANTSSLDPLDLTDERMIEDLCGLVYSLISVPTTVFQQQWDTWFNTQKQYYQENVTEWTVEQQAEFLSWRAQEEALFNLWMDGEKADFSAWVETLEGILSGDVAGNLALMIDENTQRIENHVAVMASKEISGHVILGDGLEVGDDGKVKTNTAELRTELSDRIDRNSYDDYQLWLELYYKGVIGQVEAANAKAIMFDGFMDDTLFSPYGNGVNLISNVLQCNFGAIDKVGFAIGGNKLWDYGSPNAFHNNSVNSASSGTYETLTMKNFDYKLSFGTEFDLGYVRRVSAIKLTGASPSIPLNRVVWQVEHVEGSVDGINWFTVSEALLDDVKTSIPSGGSFVLEVPIAASLILRYIRFSDNLITASSQSNNYQIRVSSISFNTKNTIASSAIYKTKTLPFMPSKATLYLSAIETDNASVIPYLSDGGGGYTEMILKTEREDSKFKRYTERIYESNGLSGSAISLKLSNLTSSSGFETAETKRLGLILE